MSVPEFDRWPGMDEAFARALAGHPVIAHIRKTNDGRPRAISDFWSIDEFHSSTLYQELYERLSTEDQLSFTVPTPDVLIGVAINRDRVGFWVATAPSPTCCARTSSRPTAMRWPTSRSAGS